jgi:hypothetical protein
MTHSKQEKHDTIWKKKPRTTNSIPPPILVEYKKEKLTFSCILGMGNKDISGK